MIGELATFLDMQYVYDNAPHRVGTIDAAKKDGLNCETLTHLLLQKLGINLAPEMRAKEIYEDTELFQPVSPENYKLGDVFFFGRENEDDPKRLHLAVFTGNFDRIGDPLLIHANWYDKGVSIWPLSKFAEHKRYMELHTVKRYDPVTNQ